MKWGFQSAGWCFLDDVDKVLKGQKICPFIYRKVGNRHNRAPASTCYFQFQLQHIAVNLIRHLPTLVSLPRHTPRDMTDVYNEKGARRDLVAGGACLQCSHWQFKLFGYASFQLATPQARQNTTRAVILNMPKLFDMWGLLINICLWMLLVAQFLVKIWISAIQFHQNYVYFF
jgi:hypothetical protein